MSFGLKDETLKRITGVFSSYPEVDEAIIFGSRAKGDYKPGSDIDIALKGERLTLRVVNKIRLSLDDLLLPYMIDLAMYHDIENPDLVSHIDRIGKTLYSAFSKNSAKQTQNYPG